MLALLGGSFDPVHQGHLKTAESLVEQSRVSELRFIPCGEHPFGKKFGVATEHRIGMLEAGIETCINAEKMRVDLREIQSPDVSYTIDTCRAIRAECGDQEPVVLVVGNDILAAMHHWESWHKLFDLVHLLVVYRPSDSTEQTRRQNDDSDKALLVHLLDEANPAVRSHLLKRYERFSSGAFEANSHGLVSCQRLGDVAMSSTQLRRSLLDFWKTAGNRSVSDPRIGELNDSRYLNWPPLILAGLSESVRAYIFKHGLYR